MDNDQVTSGWDGLVSVADEPPPERVRIFLYHDVTNVFRVGLYHDGMYWDQSGDAYHGLSKPMTFTHWCLPPKLPLKHHWRFERDIRARIEKLGNK